MTDTIAYTRYEIWWQKKPLPQPAPEIERREPHINISRLSTPEKKTLWRENQSNQAFVGFVTDPRVQEWLWGSGDIAA